MERTRETIIWPFFPVSFSSRKFFSPHFYLNFLGHCEVFSGRFSDFFSGYILLFSGKYFKISRYFFYFWQGNEFFLYGHRIFFFPVKFAFFRRKNFLSSGSFQKFFLVTILLGQNIENFLMINFFLPGKTKHCPPEGDRERRSWGVDLFVLMFDLPKGGANALSRSVPLDSFSKLNVTGERKLGFQKH